MKKHQSPDSREPTLDRSAKPRTTERTDVQIEAQKKVRKTGIFPPAPPEEDPGLEDAVERESWDRLKNQSRPKKNAPPTE